MKKTFCWHNEEDWSEALIASDGAAGLSGGPGGRRRGVGFIGTDASPPPSPSSHQTSVQNIRLSLTMHSANTRFNSNTCIKVKTNREAQRF